MIDIYCDGAGANARGIGSASFCIVKNNILIHQKSVLLKDKTNNEAEYLAILEAIHCIAPSASVTFEGLDHEDKFVIHTDSELIFSQITGRYETKKPELKALREVILHDIYHCFGFEQKPTFLWVPRENYWIKKVDQMNRDLVKKVTK